MSHTPGPWETVGATKVWSTGITGGAVAIIAEPQCLTSGHFKPVDLGSARWDEAMANARLIASAPDLLAALEEILADDPARLVLQDHTVSNARSAIAKARGE